MSTYMSESLIGKVNLDLIDNNYISLCVKKEIHKINEIHFLENKLILMFNVNSEISHDFISKNINVEDINLNWKTFKEISSYDVLSLIHNLDSEVDTYIIKIQINFEV